MEITEYIVQRSKLLAEVEPQVEEAFPLNNSDFCSSDLADKRQELRLSLYESLKEEISRKQSA